MAHTISVRIQKAIEVQNSDVVITVKVNGEKLGKLTVSRGSIDWLPKNKTVSSQVSMHWGQFAALMEDTKKPSKKSKPKKSAAASHADAVASVKEALGV